MRRAWSWTFALLLGLMATFASALEVPTDAEVFVSDGNSRIVGIGRVVAGASFELVLVEGFSGPAVVVWLSPDGGVLTTEVVVDDGVVWVGGVDLTTLLPETFGFVRVRRATELGAAWPPADGKGPPADAPGQAKGREPPAGADPPGPPGAPPGPPPGTPPGPPADGPPAADPPGPPADGPPGRSEDPPSRRP